jgi:GTP cyclohydrolase II
VRSIFDAVMFTYIDPTVRARLIEQKKLRRIDEQGSEVDVTSPNLPEDPALEVMGPIPMPIDLTGEDVLTQWYPFVRRTELAGVLDLASELRERGSPGMFASLSSFMAVNSLLAIGDADRAEHPLVRIHSNCLTGDVLGSRRCECGPQLAAAVDRIRQDAGGGYIVYMAGHEGRGIGLWAKAATYLLQDAGEDTYQANRSLGLPEDSRDFSDGRRERDTRETRRRRQYTQQELSIRQALMGTPDRRHGSGELAHAPGAAPRRWPSAPRLGHHALRAGSPSGACGTGIAVSACCLRTKWSST